MLVLIIIGLILVVISVVLLCLSEDDDKELKGADSSDKSLERDKDIKNE